MSRMPGSEIPMGRGREKAKQQRLGRSMKYNHSEPDFTALTDELHRTAARDGQPNDTEGEREQEDGIEPR
jgi:hypothetical protein